MTKPMLLIDGHNLIGKLPNISLSDPNDEARLLRVLENYYAARPHEEILVVFDPARDGGGWHGLRGRIEGVAVRFAPRGVTADDVLARLVRDARSPRSITVVSSDNAVRRAVRRNGAKVIRSEEFVEQLQLSMRPRQPSPVLPPPEERDKPSDADIEYWSQIFKEPPLLPAGSRSQTARAAVPDTGSVRPAGSRSQTARAAVPDTGSVRSAAPVRKPSSQTAEPQAPKTHQTAGAKPDSVEDIDYWLRILSAPRPDSEEPAGGSRPERVAPPLEQPRRTGRVGRLTRTSEVDSVDYWLREMSRRRPTNE